jgi:cytochrome c-type biogenesis protein CcmE
MELMMAAVITTVIGVAVAGVAMSLSTNYSQNLDYYYNVQNARSATSYMRDCLRKAKLVTATSTNTIVLWLDDNHDGQINSSEVRYWGIVSGELQELKIVYPAGLQALDTTLSLSQLTNAASALNLLRANAYKNWSSLASNASNFTVGVEPAAPLATFVKLNLTCGSSSEAIALRTAVAMRADSTALVSLKHGVYSLSTP